MRLKPTLLFFLVVWIITACRPQAEGTTTTFPPTRVPLENTASPAQSLDPFQILWDDKSIFERGLIGDAQSSLHVLSTSTNYHMDWIVAPDLGSMTATAEILYTNNESVALEVIYLRLYPNLFGGQMEITSIEVDGKALQGSLEAADSLYRVDLTQELAPGQQVVITLTYSLDLPREMSGNYGLFGSFEGFLLLQEGYPIIPVYDENGWDIDFPAQHGDVIHIDRSFYIVRVSLPAYMNVITSGIELDRVLQDEWQSITFAAGPARDFYLGAAEHLQQKSISVGNIIINSYTFPEVEESSEVSLQIVKEALKIFDQRLGSYPYTEFDLISTPMQALGMEYPGIVAQNIRMYDPDAIVSDLPAPILLESVTVHELAHQWFYNLVGNDQVQNPWMDEAIVQYVTGIYYHDRYGEQAYQSYRQSWIDRWDRVDQQPIPIGLPAVEYDEESYSPIVYGRGPLFVEALADRLGEDLFWKFMSDYVDQYQWDIAQPEDFITLAEDTCECELDDLWETWGVYP